MGQGKNISGKKVRKPQAFRAPGLERRLLILRGDYAPNISLEDVGQIFIL